MTSDVKTAYAEYFKWEDLNVNQDQRVGYFVQDSNTSSCIEIFDGTKDCLGVVLHNAAVSAKDFQFDQSNKKKEDKFGKIIQKDSYVFSLVNAIKEWGIASNVKYDDVDLYEDIQIIFDRDFVTANGYISGNSNDNVSIIAIFETLIDDYRNDNSLDATQLNLLTTLETTIDNMTLLSIDEQYDTNPAQENVIEWDIVGLIGRCRVFDDGTCNVGSMCDATNTGISTDGSTWLVLERIDTDVVEIMFVTYHNNVEAIINSDLSSVGTGETLINDGTGPTLALKSFSSADNTITIQSTATDITLRSNIYPTNNNVFVVSKSGIQGTYSTIKDAVDAANLVDDKARVVVEPGEYTEANPIIVGSRVAVDGEDTARTVYVFPDDPTAEVFHMQAASEIKGIRIDGANGIGGIGIFFDGSVVSALSHINTTIITNCETGIHCDGSPGVILIRDTIATSDPSTGTKLTTGIRISNGCDVRIIDSGVNGYDDDALRLDEGVIVESSSKLSATHLTISGCVYGFYLDAAEKVYHKASRLIDNQTAVHIENDTFFFQSGVNYLNSTNWDIDVAAATNEEIVITACTLDRTKINNPNNVKLLYSGFSNDPSDPALLVLAELHVGAPNNPRECAFGSGETYTVDMVVITNTNEEAGTWADMTIESQSKDGSSFNGFSGLTAGHCLYIGGPRPFPGFKCQLVTKMDPSTATVIMEYWDGSQWIDFCFFVSESDPPYYPVSNNLFDAQSTLAVPYSGIETRFGKMVDWTTKTTLDGVANLYWVRAIISSGTTLLPARSTLAYISSPLGLPCRRQLKKMLSPAMSLQERAVTG